MQFSTLLPVSLLLSVGLAQTTLSAASLPSSTACAAKEVFDSCLATGQGYASSCAPTDYACLCQKWGDILTCYLQCPNDPGYAGALTSKTTYCSYASQYSSSTSSAISRAVSAAVSSPVSSATGAAGAATTEGSSGGVRTSSGSTPAATSKSSAERMVVGAGVGLMGLVAAVL